MFSGKIGRNSGKLPLRYCARNPTEFNFYRMPLLFATHHYYDVSRPYKHLLENTTLNITFKPCIRNYTKMFYMHKNCNNIIPLQTMYIYIIAQLHDLSLSITIIHTACKNYEHLLLTCWLK